MFGLLPNFAAAHDALWFPAALLRRPSRNANPGLHRLLWQHAQAQLAELVENDLLNRLSYLLGVRLGQADCSLRACAGELAAWMREVGFDEVAIDAVGNVRGRYHAASERSAGGTLYTGSHYDTVRNGGKYDGRLGILVPLAVVRRFRAAGVRLPYHLELIAFAEEEGQRFPATFLGSSAVIGRFDPAWLEQVDAGGDVEPASQRRASSHAWL